MEENFRKKEFIMNKTLIFCTLSLVLFASTGCRAPEKPKPPIKPRYDQPLPPGQLALRKIIDPARIPDFTYASYGLEDIKDAIGYSLNYLTKPSSKQFFPYGTITHDDAYASLEAFAELLEQGLTGKELNAAIRQKFDVYESVGCDNKGTVLFTGYYTPIFDGSIEETPTFKYPLYKQPKDLLKGPDGIIEGRKMPDGSVTPYPSRKEIGTTGMLAGTELLYMSDPFEVYIAHVQGSAKIRLPDGELITVGYAASNGHEYKSVSRAMLDDRALSGEKMSLSAMIDYFKRHPDKIAPYIEKNPRFVFFQTAQSEPHGSINTPVTPMRTIATDKSVYPRACLAFLSTTLPRQLGTSIVHRKYNGFALDQDTGGAIRAPGRCDIYMGVGDQAGKLAGQIYKEGRLYYLFLK